METREKGFITKRWVLTSLAAGALLVVVNSAIWTNQQIFSTEKFTNTAVGAMTSESSRQALASRITDEVLEDRPVAKNVVGDQVSNVIAGLLGTDQAEKLLAASVTKLHIYVTSENQQDVDVDLTGLKATMTRVIEATDNERVDRVDPAKIPDRIVIIEEKNVPDLYTYGVALSWLAPIGFMLAVVLLALPYIWDRKHYLLILATQGVMLVLAGIVSLLLGPLFRPVALEPFQNPNGRVVAGNLYDAFISTFGMQTMFLVYLGALACLVAAAIRIYPEFTKAWVGPSRRQGKEKVATVASSEAEPSPAVPKEKRPNQRTTKNQR